MSVRRLTVRTIEGQLSLHQPATWQRFTECSVIVARLYTHTASYQARRYRALFTTTATSTLEKKLLHTKCRKSFFPPLATFYWWLPTFTFCNFTRQLFQFKEEKIDLWIRLVTVKIDHSFAALWSKICGAMSILVSVYLFAHIQYTQDSQAH